MATYEINGEFFKSQEKALAYVRQKLKEFGPGIVWPQDEEKFGFLSKILNRHPNADSKREKGVAGFRIFADPRGGMATFIITNAQRELDFSWNACVTRRQASEDEKLLIAMRASIKDQMQDFKREAFASGEAFCYICGQQVSQDNCHVDHVVPFRELSRQMFTTISGLKFTIDEDTQNGGFVFASSDRHLEAAWQNFHRANAVLKIACAPCNIAKG